MGEFSDGCHFHGSSRTDWLSDHTGAKILYPTLPDAEALIADKGYDSDEFRSVLHAKGFEPWIPPKANRRFSIPYDATLYGQGPKIEIMFGLLKDWRRFAIRYDRCAHTFFSAICLAASVIFWL